MHLRQQTGDDLHLLRAVLVFRAINLRRVCPTLLLGLTCFDPLFHGKVLTKTGQVILLEIKTLEQRAVGDGIEEDVVVGPEHQESAESNDSTMCLFLFLQMYMTGLGSGPHTWQSRAHQDGQRVLGHLEVREHDEWTT